MKHILILLLLTPSLAGCLTFKDGKQVNDKYLDSEYSFVPDSEIRWSEPTGNLRGKYEILFLTPAKTPYAHAWVNDIVRDGDHAIRLELRGLECNQFDCTRGRFKGWAGRTEFGFYDAKLTGENWFRWSVYIPEETDQIRPAWTMITQFKTSTKAEVHDDCPIMPFYLLLDMQGIIVRSEPGDAHPTGGYCSNSNQDKLVVSNSENFKGRWLDFVLHSNWSDTDDGFMNLWVDGHKRYTHQGANLVRASNQYPPIMRFPIYNGKRHPERDKDNKQVIYYDAFYSAKTCEKMNMESLGYDCKDFK